MPIQRVGTPPTSKIKEERSVLNTLSAWTDTGEDEVTAKTPLLERQVSVKDRFLAAIDSESDNFHMAIGCVIFLNAAVIGLETEFGRGHFLICEHVFNAVFFTEMCLRMRQWGIVAYFQDLWNIFDFTLVMIGTLDLWILPHLIPGHAASAHKGHKQVGYQFSVLRLLRILRLLRVLRVVRLFRMFHQLFLIMQAFNKAFQIVLLIGILVAILDYAFAIILTQGIGHNASEWGEDKAQLEQWFGSIPNSMQTLFCIMTLTGWAHISEKLSEVIPEYVVYPVLALYIMITSYTMISLITGIISESLITSQQEFRRKALTKMDGKRRELVNELRGFLYEMHEDEMDELAAVEAEDLKTSVRGDNELLNKLADIGISIDEGGVLALIDKMSLEGQQRINMDYFVNKLVNLQGFANASAVIDLKYELLRIQTTIQNIASKRYPNDPPLLTPKPPDQEEGGPRRNSQMYAEPLSKKSSLRAGSADHGNGSKPKRASGCVQIGGEE